MNHHVFWMGVLLASLGQAQSPVTLAAAGYQNPPFFPVAPGQVITLYATGVPTLLPPDQSGVRESAATDTPLPAMLAGFSVTVTQLPGGSPKQAPMLSVVQTSHCTDPSASSPACFVTALTVQMPDMQVPVLASSSGVTQLAIFVDGVPSQAFGINPVNENIHILTTGNPVAGPALVPSVTHLDGGLVSAASPARAGEILVMYAVGLGSTIPAVPEGQLTPLSAPQPTFFQWDLTFSYTFNYAQGTSPAQATAAASTISPPIFAGLTPGQVGLYQINFAVPSPPSGAASCGTGGNSRPNLTVSAYSQAFAPPGFTNPSDTAAICVATSP